MKTIEGVGVMSRMSRKQYADLFGPTTGDRMSPPDRIDQGPVVLMIENYRTGRIWGLMRRCPLVVTGLRRGRFTGGWLWRGHASRLNEVALPGEDNHVGMLRASVTSTCARKP